MTKHTPGPWKVKHEFNVFGPNDVGVASCAGHSDNRRDPSQLFKEQRSNARLIAAAPDLLEACRMLANSRSGTGWVIGNVEIAAKMAEEAIAKAERQ